MILLPQIKGLLLSAMINCKFDIETNNNSPFSRPTEIKSSSKYSTAFTPLLNLSLLNSSKSLSKIFHNLTDLSLEPVTKKLPLEEKLTEKIFFG